MSVAKRLGLIALGYVLAVAGGFVAAGINELLMPADISQGSPGMVAFGNMILCVLVAGFLGLVPTWFLIRFAIERAPRAALAALLLIATAGPLSWLAMVDLARRGPGQHAPEAGDQLLGLLIAFGAIPRIVAGPVLVVVEALTILLVRQRLARALLAASMLMDLIPMGLYAVRMASAMLR